MTERLLRCRFWKSEPSRGPPSPSASAMCSGISILTQFAPQSASWRTQVGPARTRVRSSTVKRLSAVEARGNISGPADGDREADNPRNGPPLSTAETLTQPCACVPFPGRFARQRIAHLRHRQAHLRAVDQARAPQPVLDRRRARLGEQQPRQLGEIAPGPQRGRLVAGVHEIADGGETRGVDMRRGENAAVGALRQRRVEQRVLAGHHGKSRRLRADEIERLRLVGAAVLHAGDVGQRGQAQQRVVRHVHAGAIRDVVDDDRPRGLTRQRREVAIEPFLRGPRVIRARDQVAIDRPRGRARERLAELARIAARNAEEDRDLSGDFAGDDRDQPLRLLVVDRQPLAGRRRQNEAVDRLGQIMARHPPQRCLVERAVAERRDQRQPDSLNRHRPSPSCVPEERAKTKKPRPEPAGLWMSLAFAGVFSATRAEIRSPEWRIFWISARSGSSPCGQYRGRAHRCQRSPRPDSRG